MPKPEIIDPPRELDMVRIIRDPIYWPESFESRVGWVGWISIIKCAEDGTDAVYMVTFIKNRKTHCGFYTFPEEIEIVKRRTST